MRITDGDDRKAIYSLIQSISALDNHKKLPILTDKKEREPIDDRRECRYALPCFFVYCSL